MSIRLVDAGNVPGVRSQTVYHGLAHSFNKDTPKTIILASAKEPVVCIGFHQDLKKEVDLDFCLKNNIPIIRREVGGGAVFLDRNQLFTQWVFPPNDLPMRIEERFKLHGCPIIETYKAIGIEAKFSPVNDIQVDGKKIGGMGAAAIGNAEVLVGNFIFDFDFEMMSRVLKTPGEKFRNKIHQSLQTYMTTVKKELGSKPNEELVKKLYIEKCQKVLGEKIEIGRFTPPELQVIKELDLKFSSKEWLFTNGSYVRPAVKIHSDVWVGQVNIRTKYGLIYAIIRFRNNCVDDVELWGDFLPYPKKQIQKLEQALLQTEISLEKLNDKFQLFYKQENAYDLGIESQEWVRAIVSLAQSIQKS